MKNKIALAFTGEGANDAIRGLMKEYADALAAIGWSVVNVDTDPAELQYAVDRMAAGEVGFALTWVGFGQDLSVMTPTGQRTSVWETFGVPCLKLHGDLPAYFSMRHGNQPRNAVNLYHAAEFAHFRRHWLSEARTISAVIPALPLCPINRSDINLALRRRGKFVFIKNGNPPQELRQAWQARLPQATANLISDMADAISPIALNPGILHIGDFVGDFLGAEGIDPHSVHDLHLFFSAQLDDYLRRVKSNMIAESLLDFPVLVQGGLWQHIDFTGHRAQLVEGQDYAATQQVYSDQLGIIDMSPNIDTWPHDRVQRAAGAFLPVLTNRQSWIAEKFPGFDDLVFEFNPDSIKACVADAIAQPDRYLELGMEFGERFREVYPREAFARRIIDMAELAAFQWSPNKPQIQPFFAWPIR